MKTKKLAFCFIVITVCILGMTLMSCGNSRSNTDEKLEELLSDEGWDGADLVTVTKTFVPDSLKREFAEWIKETLRAASFHMTTCDYEDPEDVIKEAAKTGTEYFSRTFEYEGLRLYKDNHDAKNLCYQELTLREKKIFDYLKNKQ